MADFYSPYQRVASYVAASAHDDDRANHLRDAIHKSDIEYCNECDRIEAVALLYLEKWFTIENKDHS